jgi:hypothetical protein
VRSPAGRRLGQGDPLTPRRAEVRYRATVSYDASLPLVAGLGAVRRLRAWSSTPWRLREVENRQAV